MVKNLRKARLHVMLYKPEHEKKRDSDEMEQNGREETQ